jgi:hypothetical protein
MDVLKVEVDVVRVLFGLKGHRNIDTTPSDKPQTFRENTLDQDKNSFFSSICCLKGIGIHRGRL